MRWWMPSSYQSVWMTKSSKLRAESSNCVRMRNVPLKEFVISNVSRTSEEVKMKKRSTDLPACLTIEHFWKMSRTRAEPASTPREQVLTAVSTKALNATSSQTVARTMTWKRSKLASTTSSQKTTRASSWKSSISTSRSSRSKIVQSRILTQWTIWICRISRAVIITELIKRRKKLWTRMHIRKSLSLKRRSLCNVSKKHTSTSSAWPTHLTRSQTAAQSKFSKSRQVWSEKQRKGNEQ